MVNGTSLPWTLIVCTVLGVLLMFTRVLFETTGQMASSDHLVGALVVTFSITAMAEVARPTRFINVLFGLWLIAAPWVLGGVTSNVALWSSMFVGVLLIALSLPRGAIKRTYGTWDRYLV